MKSNVSRLSYVSAIVCAILVLAVLVFETDTAQANAHITITFVVLCIIRLDEIVRMLREQKQKEELIPINIVYKD